MADEFFLDPRAVRRSFDRASRTYDATAAVQAEIRTRLLERLDVVRLQPTAVLDLGAGTGHASRDLKRRYPSAQIVALDSSWSMLRESARQQRFLRLAAQKTRNMAHAFGQDQQERHLRTKHPASGGTAMLNAKFTITSHDSGLIGDR